MLLRGETGTGKSLFARAIHVNSKRQARPFVVVDCTTLPAQLVESELFGHERGAFTGADKRVVGKVELAAGGTLFLDEIGDLPLDIQGKLLRFLQERAYERVGGRETLHADVRVVCATHRDLEAAVEAGRFREDLYYRARVVEIELPPLRDRGADEIEALARHFADTFAARYARPSPAFDDDALAAIVAHDYPGNVRELEHWIESAIALAPDGRVTLAHLPSRRMEDRARRRRRSASSSTTRRATRRRGVAPLGLHARRGDAALRAPRRSTRAAATRRRPRAGSASAATRSRAPSARVDGGT